jgi:hypothetical protein
MDPNIALATSVVATLAPYLVKAGEEFAKEVGKTAVSKIETLYQFLNKRFKNHPSAKEALDDLKTKPDDEDAQAALRVQIKKLLKADPTLVKTIQQMLDEIKQDKASVSFLTQVNGNVDQINNAERMNVTFNKGTGKK